MVIQLIRRQIDLGNLISKFGEEISELGNSISEFGEEISELGNSISKFGEEISELGNSISEFGEEIFPLVLARLHLNSDKMADNTAVGIAEYTLHVKLQGQEYDGAVGQAILINKWGVGAMHYVAH